MSASKLCSQCQQPIPESAPEGACPACLLQMAVEISTSPSSAGSFTAPSVEELNRQITSLHVEKLIGRGGMSAVFLARQKMLNREVALKVLPCERARDPEFVERFIREATSLAKLNHPHIVNVFDAGQSGEFLYIVMEYVEGASLRTLIADGRLQPSEAMDMVRQICDAMQYVHDNGVVHRDIKPENVLVDNQGRIKVADFGLAKLTEEGVRDQAELTQTNARMGTMGYMSPEQFANTAAVDHRADIYSLGIIFYEMLTGDLPTLEFKRPSQKIDVDPRVDHVVARSTRERPSDRYQQAIEVRKDVERIASTPRVNTRYLVTALVLILFGVTAAGVWNWQRGRQSRLEPGNVVVTILSLTEPSAGEAKAIPSNHTRPVGLIPTRKGRAELVQDLLEMSKAVVATVVPPDGTTVGLSDSELILSHILTSPDWEWSEPVRLLNEDDSIKSYAPHLSPNELHLVFTTEQPPDNKQFVREMRRSTLQSAWGAPSSMVSQFPTLRVFKTPCLIRNETVLLFNSPDYHPSASGSDDLWMATRKSESDPWSDPAPLSTTINSRGRDLSPFMTNDGLTLMWAADRALTGETDLWMAQRGSVDQSFSEPVSLGNKVNSPAMENLPRLTADERVLVFASNRDQPRGTQVLYFSVREHREAPWSIPVNAGNRINLPNSDTHAIIAADGRTMFLSRYGYGKATLWVSQRVPRTKPKDLAPVIPDQPLSTKSDAELAASHILTSPDWGWTEPQRVVELPDSPMWDYHPSVSPDGLDLVFASTRPNHGRVHVWQTSRASEDAAWSTPTQVTIQADADFEMSSPCLSADSLTLLFDNGHSHPDGAGPDDLWLVKRESKTQPWGTPVPLGKDINWTGRDWTASLSHDGLTLLWSSDRPGGLGEMDLWMSERTTLDDPFGTPRNLGPNVNSPSREHSPELSADGLALMFASDRSRAADEIMICIRESRKSPWSRPINVVNGLIGPTGAWTATVTSDCKTLIFAKSENNFASLWMTRRIPRKTSKSPSGDGLSDSPSP